MIISVEKLTRELIKECTPLLKDNYKESGHFHEPLDIHWESYLALGDAFVPIVMRREDGKLKGVLFFLVSLYSHISTLLMAQQITFYVSKDSRFFAIKMIDFSENFLDEIGVDFILQSARYDTGFCSVLERKGYSPSDIQFIKRLK